ncbi:hypothetical protein WJX84_001447 [Apatococcus fuscideae]|uniref:CUE domain-containing protein n=1 Tax=Apatococcus fuscideae TaxID=2026836 RepID=A0AAW1RYJ6_9CHLO
MSEVEVQLAEAFPEVPRSRLRQVLNAAGEDVHAAAAQLLEEAVSQQPAVAAKSEPQRQQQQAASRTQPQSPSSVLDARLEDPADAAQQPLPYSAVVGAQPNGPRSKLRGLHRKSRSLDGADVQISRTSPWDGSEGPASDGYAEDEQALRLAHPWASEELTRAVLIAAKHHHLTAAALLRDMGPQAAVAAAAATPAGAWELSAQTQQHLTISQASQSQLRADAPSWSPSGTAAPKEAHGHLDPGGTSTDEDPCEEDDPYWQLRRPALRLTREWQRLLRRAAASYSLDDHHSARALAAEARGVRERAMAAHTAAAAAIQAANNKDKGPLTVPLRSNMSDGAEPLGGAFMEQASGNVQTKGTQVEQEPSEFTVSGKSAQKAGYEKDLGGRVHPGSRGVPSTANVAVVHPEGSGKSDTGFKTDSGAGEIETGPGLGTGLTSTGDVPTGHGVGTGIGYDTGTVNFQTARGNPKDKGTGVYEREDVKGDSSGMQLGGSTSTVGQRGTANVNTSDQPSRRTGGGISDPAQGTESAHN